MKTRQRKHWPAFYNVTRVVITSWLKLWLRYRAYGNENVPREGGCILAANHASYLDPSLVACGIWHRSVRFMARDSLFRFPGFAQFMYWIGVVPLSRERGDVGALKRAIQLLKEGACICLYPEGTRTSDGELQVAKGGIGFLIAKAGVPVIPTYIDGSFRAYPRGVRMIKPVRCRVYYGRPIEPSELAAFGTERDAYAKIGQLVMARIRELKDDANARE
ncbi:MAG: lysophospholipid acyltransferase family protein [bacterium]